ncbi:MAG: PorT family protein [Muribaculaceae bacterium]|nr:PorT family protein [Muribaculaceae bacterium]
MLRKNIFLLPLLLVAPALAEAATFFDTSVPESLMGVGVRLGVNTTNRNLNKDVFNVWNVNSWGTGVDVGAVVNINFRNYLTIQPGLFYESRSGKYAYVNTAGYDDDGVAEYMTQYGRDRSYNFTVPIMAQIHFNLSDDIRWDVEAGPYFQFKLKNSVNGDFSYPVYANPMANPVSYVPIESSKFDFGMKFGTGLRILDHYLVAVHYEAGWLKPWTDSRLGGRNKGWVFSVGYDF